MSTCNNTQYTIQSIKGNEVKSDEILTIHVEGMEGYHSS